MERSFFAFSLRKGLGRVHHLLRAKYMESHESPPSCRLYGGRFISRGWFVQASLESGQLVLLSCSSGRDMKFAGLEYMLDPLPFRLS